MIDAKLWIPEENLKLRSRERENEKFFDAAKANSVLAFQCKIFVAPQVHLQSTSQQQSRITSTPNHFTRDGKHFWIRKTIFLTNNLRLQCFWQRGLSFFLWQSCSTFTDAKWMHALRLKDFVSWKRLTSTACHKSKPLANLIKPKSFTSLFMPFSS